MLPSNPFAFKEWGAICAALAVGAQTLIIRKGGIHEGREGFRVDHREFWLFPTFLHESAAGLATGAAHFLERAEADRPAAGLLSLSLYAVVDDVFEVNSEAALARLAGEHVWSRSALEQRFSYRRPGVFVLAARIYRGAPQIIPDSPHFAGCRSWVEFPGPISTVELQPVLTDEDYARRREKIHAALEGDKNYL